MHQWHACSPPLLIPLEPKPAAAPPVPCSGVLYFHEGTFTLLQMLEGPTAAVVGLFQTIRTDPRHSSVQVISHSRVTRRIFTSLGMMLVAPLEGVLFGDGCARRRIAPLVREHAEVARREAAESAILSILNDSRSIGLDNKEALATW